MPSADRTTVLHPRDVRTELAVLIRSRYPILWVVSWEEERVEAALTRISAERRKRFVCWSVTRGFHEATEPPGLRRTPPAQQGNVAEVLAALDEIVKQVEPALYLFKDLHPFLSDPVVVRKLRDLAAYLKSSPKTLILCSPSRSIPPDLEKDITVVDFGLPTLEELGQMLDTIVSEVSTQGRLHIDLSGAVREKLLQAALGLTLKEAENAFARTLVEHERLTDSEVACILNEKKQVIQKSGILEYHDAQDHLDDVGGMQNLKDWVRKRSVAFSDEARRFGLPPPRGVLLLGVQGCGKSLAARAISLVWRLPLLRLDVGRIFSSFIGSSEENARKAMSTAESLAPSLLWIDEIEKAFAGGTGSGEVDAGTTSRIFGTFLTWLQEKTAPVFVVATANNIRSLPPELLRKGRFDEIFFVDLPGAQERAEIFDIHLRRRNRDPQHFDLARLAALADGFSGSEIEQAVVSALYDSFDARHDLQEADLERSVTQSVPLSRTMHEELTELRHWARSRTRPATVVEIPENPQPGDEAFPTGNRVAPAYG